MAQAQIDSILKNQNILDSGTNLRRIGISNIKERLHFMYGKEAGLSINSIPEVMTAVQIHIPME